MRFADEREPNPNPSALLEPAVGTSPRKEQLPPRGEPLAPAPDSAAQLLDELIVRGEQLRHQLVSERDSDREPVSGSGDALAPLAAKSGSGSGLGMRPELVHLGPPVASKNPDVRAMQLLLGRPEMPPVHLLRIQPPNDRMLVRVHVEQI